MKLKPQSPSLEGFKVFMWYMFVCILVSVALYVSFVPPELNAIFSYYGSYKGFVAAQNKEIIVMTNNYHYYWEILDEQQSREKISCTKT